MWNYVAKRLLQTLALTVAVWLLRFYGDVCQIPTPQFQNLAWCVLEFYSLRSLFFHIGMQFTFTLVTFLVFIQMVSSYVSTKVCNERKTESIIKKNNIAIESTHVIYSQRHRILLSWVSPQRSSISMWQFAAVLYSAPFWAASESVTWLFNHIISLLFNSNTLHPTQYLELVRLIRWLYTGPSQIRNCDKT